MSVKIRLQRHGSKKRPFYFIVVANSVSPRDGKFIEKLGTYNPLTIPATVRIDRDRALYWMQQGAQPTNTCRRILSFKGVLFLKHLMRGVGLGLFTEQEAIDKFEKWNVEHEQLVATREETHRKHKHDKRKAVVSESVKKVEEKMAVRAAAQQPEAPAETPETEETPAPETTAPEASAPEAATPEASAPETIAPEATAPEATAPETTAAPEAPAPEATSDQAEA